MPARQVVGRRKNPAMFHVKIGEAPLGAKIMGILREDADEGRVIDRSRKTVRGDKSEARTESTVCANLHGMRYRRSARFELKNVFEIRKRAAFIQRSGWPRR